MTRSGFPTRGALRRLAIDIGPLRTSRDFRLLWLGELVSTTGSQIALVAVYVQVFALTHSPAAVGLVGLVQVIPLALAAVFGGPIIDTLDRRRLLLWSQGGQVVATGVLVAGALADHPPLAVVYAGAALVAGFSGFALSVRGSIIPNVLTANELPAALALNQAMFSTTLIVGPAIGGVVIDQLGLSVAYAIDLVSFAAVIAAAIMLRPQIPKQSPSAEARGGSLAGGLAQITEGLRFLRGQRVLQSAFYVDLIAMIFGMPRALFPVLAVTQFGASASTRGSVVGLLFSAVAVGALVGALTTGWVGRVQRHGLAVLWAVAAWGAGIVGFGLSGSSLVVAASFLAVAGAADVVSAVFRGSIVQNTVPDGLRGRMSGVHILVVVGGPRIGDIEAGLVATAFTPVISVITGGAVCILGVAALALRIPEFARYRAPQATETTG